MKRLLTFILLFTSICRAFAQPSDSVVQAIMSAGHIPGAEAVLIKDSHWVYDHSWGYADIDKHIAVNRETIFMMASISKTVIATALMQQWEKGAFKLDDNINDYLPFKVENPHAAGVPITFRMLMDHTSSIQDNYDVINGNYVYGDSPISLDTFLRNYLVPGGSYYNAAKNYYYYRPANRYNYSNIGATLAAYLVQRITGDDYGHYCDTAIFEKLCMDNTSLKLAGIKDTSLIARPYTWSSGIYYDEGLYGYPDYPDGQLRTNITALARFMTMYMQHGTYNGEQILQSVTVDTILTYQHYNFGQGLIFFRYLSNGDTLWGHTGGDAGVSTAMFFSMRKQIGSIVFCNSEGTNADNMQTILDEVYKYGLTVTPAPTDTFPACHYNTTAIKDIPRTQQFSVNVYPNPAADLLHIDIIGCTPGSLFKATIINIVGSVVTSAICNKANTIINTSSFAPGVYILMIDNNVSKQIIRFVKN